ncbi:Glutamine synthetase, partial [Brevibacterium aurantiacum]
MVITHSIVDPFTDEPYSRDPRQVAEKAEAYLRSTGIADTVNVGAEAEFYLFDEIRYQNTPGHSFYQIDSIEAAWNTGADEPGGNLGYKTPMKGGYFPVSPQDHFADIRDEISLTLGKIGFTVERAHHEVGTAGQQEINYRFNTLKHAADELSDLARWYIGGLIEPAGAVLAFTNPTINSYRRLVKGYEAPVNLVYSARNRSAAIRIPVTGSSPKAKRLEFRVPDPSSNPYLAFSAQLMAGLDGIKNRIEPPEPIDKDLYELPPEELEGIALVPQSLEEALVALEQDTDFLTAGDVFTEDLIETLQNPTTGRRYFRRVGLDPWVFGTAAVLAIRLFVARISRGRTLREFVIAAITAPVLCDFFIVSIFGNSALARVFSGDRDFAQLAIDSPEQGWYALLEQFPGAAFLIGLATLSGLLFYLTSANSGAMVMSNFSSTIPDPSQDGAKWLRIFWALLTALLTISMLVA